MISGAWRLYEYRILPCQASASRRLLCLWRPCHLNSITQHQTGPSTLPSSEHTLARLRDDIDTIDDGILDLMLRRTAMVEQVVAAKADAGTLDRYLRPGREARILRRLAVRNAGVFPPTALMRIWREMLCALLPVQGPFSVTVGGSDPGLWETARDFYGSCSVMTRSPDGVAAMCLVEQATDQLAVVHAFDDDVIGTLATKNREALHIVTRLPFVPPVTGSGPRCEAFVLSRDTPEPSGDDVTVLAFFEDPEAAVPEVRRHGDVWIAEIAGCHVGDETRQISWCGLTAMVLGTYPALLRH